MDKEEEEGTALYNEIESKMIQQNDLKYEYTMLEREDRLEEIRKRLLESSKTF